MTHGMTALLHLLVLALLLYRIQALEHSADFKEAH
jgi:hypothetical protein